MKRWQRVGVWAMCWLLSAGQVRAEDPAAEHYANAEAEAAAAPRDIAAGHRMYGSLNAVNGLHRSQHAAWDTLHKGLEFACVDVEGMTEHGYDERWIEAGLKLEQARQRLENARMQLDMAWGALDRAATLWVDVQQAETADEARQAMGGHYLALAVASDMLYGAKDDGLWAWQYLLDAEPILDALVADYGRPAL